MALNQREKALLTLPVILGGVIGFYNWVQEPLSVRQSEAKTKFEQVQGELKKDEAKLAREGDIAARTSAVSAEEMLIDAWVPGKNAAALFIWHLSQAESYSGVRIKSVTLSDKKQVTSVARQGQAPEAPPAPGASGTKPNTPPQAAKTPGYDVTVIRLELKLEGQYAQHLLFNQMIEQLPLFLSADAISLQSAEKATLADATKLLGEGKIQQAELLLGASPKVAGNYALNLYFKVGKPGPATTAMSFDQEAGRIDPFAPDSVDVFIDSILQHYSDPGTKLPVPDGGGIKPDGPINPGINQMG